MNLAGKTVFVSGGSRGIGLGIALKLASHNANIIIAAKTAEPHAKLPGTIYTAAKEIEKAGGYCLPLEVDIRHEDQVIKAFEEGAKKFGGIDILVNNASAISLTGTLDTPMKKYDLMNQVNARGTYLCSQVAIPYLKKSQNPHILTLSPPLNLDPKWFKNHVAYTMAKYGMSMCVLGMSEELKEDGIAVNALWPMTAIETAAIDLIASSDMRKKCRKIDIMADAAYLILTKNSRQFTGNFVIDEEILRNEKGLTNFDQYAVEPGNELLLDFFLDEKHFKHLNNNPKLINETKTSTSGNHEKSDSTELFSAFKQINNLLSLELVTKIQGIYSFKIPDANPSDWYLDLKHGSGETGVGKTSKASCFLEMKQVDFIKMINGQMKPTTAFMTGKLKIKGDMSLAMKLEKVLANVKSKL